MSFVIKKYDAIHFLITLKRSFFMDYTAFINKGINSSKHLWYEAIITLRGSYNELFILNSFICTDSKASTNKSL